MKRLEASVRLTRSLLLPAALGVSLSGCAHLPLIGRKDRPTEPPPATEVSPVTDPDSAAVSPPSRSPGSARRLPPKADRPGEPPTATPAPAPDMGVTPAAEATPERAPAAPDSAASTPVLSADIPPAERAQLLESHRQDCRRTEELLGKLGSHDLSTPDAEKLRTARELLRAAQDAELRGELRDAANLARKAWLLALDLSGR